MIFFLVSTEYIYSHLGTGYCSDWVYLPEGGYPDRLDAGDEDYDADPIQECMNRCLGHYEEIGERASTAGEEVGDEAFYLKSDDGCACAIGDCSSLKTGASDGYESYEIILGNR